MGAGCFLGGLFGYGWGFGFWSGLAFVVFFGSGEAFLVLFVWVGLGGVVFFGLFGGWGVGVVVLEEGFF